MDAAHLRAPKYDQILREIDGGSRRVCVITTSTAAHSFRPGVMMGSITNMKALHALKSEAGALLSSRAKRRPLKRMEVDDGGGVRAIFTRRMMEQLRKRETPGPWRLITADRGIKFSRSIPSRCCCRRRCCCCCWPASSLLFEGKGGQPIQTSAT